MAEEEFIVAIRDSSVRDIWKEAERERERREREASGPREVCPEWQGYRRREASEEETKPRGWRVYHSG